MSVLTAAERVPPWARSRLRAQGGTRSAVLNPIQVKAITLDTFAVKIRVHLRKSAYKIPNSERHLK